ncbi:MAG: thiamine pyrophosphate-binding protein [Candidatus Hodarchaeales archaeon]|jgi:phosphonopyruvate decarboxylase
MIDPSQFMSFLEKKFQYISGVPCSYFKDFLAYLASHETETHLKHVYATREDEAIGIASGVAFSGKRALVYMQNSGLGNIGDALTSLAQLYKLPMLMLISYRGLESDKDFPEHSIMGEINEPVLNSLKVPYWILSEASWEQEMTKALQKMEETSSPVALLVELGVLCQ